MSNELQAVILNVIGSAYLTYTVLSIGKVAKKRKYILLLAVSVLFGALIAVADPKEAALLPFSTAAFHFLFRFLWHHIGQIRKNIRSMAQPIRFDKTSAGEEQSPALSDKQAS